MDSGHFNSRSVPKSTRSLISYTWPRRATTGSRSSLPELTAYLATIGVTGAPGADNAHFNQPLDAEFNSSTNQIMVADSMNSRVQLFDAASFAYTSTLGGAGLSPTNNNYFGTPVTAAFDPTTNLILIADTGADDRVQVLDALTYEYVMTIGTTGSRGSADSQFAGPAGVAIDPAHGQMFIGDGQNDRVQIFSIESPINFASVLPGSRSTQSASRQRSSPA